MSAVSFFWPVLRGISLYIFKSAALKIRVLGPVWARKGRFLRMFLAKSPLTDYNNPKIQNMRKGRAPACT